MTDGDPRMIRVLLHAPTAAALQRARRNLVNLLAAAPEAEVELVINGQAVGAALDAPDMTDPYLVICRNSLAAAGLAAPAGRRTTAAAVLHLARRQAEGWSYIRT